MAATMRRVEGDTDENQPFDEDISFNDVVQSGENAGAAVKMQLGGNVRAAVKAQLGENAGTAVKVQLRENAGAAVASSSGCLTPISFGRKQQNINKKT